MSGFSEIASLIILCFYKFDKAKNIQRFVKQFNAYFDQNIGEQTIVYEISIIKSAEASANMSATKERLFYRELWKKYASRNGGKDIRQLYTDFKNGKYIDATKEKQEFSLQDIALNTSLVLDQPVMISDLQLIPETEVVRRSKCLVAYALAFAQYRCECNCNIPLFIRKDGKTHYTEAHHLIPLRYQKEFDVSLDVAANIISLCPCCHRKLHYGLGTEAMLNDLLSQRHERLLKCGIEITLADLLLMYR